MRQLIAATALAFAASANAACLDSDKVELILAAHDRNESLATIQKGFFPHVDADTAATIAQVYGSGVKPWDASNYSMALCNPAMAFKLDDAETERRKEVSYRDSFNRMPNIPGICVGESCNHIRKIQHWNANGEMTN